MIFTYDFNSPTDYTLTNTSISGGKGVLSLTDNVSQTFNQAFTSDTGFTYNSNKVEFTGGLLRTKLINLPGLLFTETFDSDTGFTYDSSKTEFIVSTVRQKDQTPTNSVFGGNFDSAINLDWNKDAATTGTANGTPAIVGNKIECTGELQKGVYWTANTNSAESHKFIYTPDYTTSPGQNVNILSCYNGSDNNDRFNIIHSPSGDTIRFTLYNSSGTLLLSTVAVGAAWNPTSGTDYEFEVSFDSVTGVVRLFIDGVLHGSNSPGAWTRVSAASRFYLGACPVVYNVADAYFDKYIYFEDIQHTSGYTKGYTISENIYLADTITLPEMEYTGSGTLISFDSFTTTELNSPRYTIQVGRSGNYLYWDGAAWSVSDGTYAQANDSTTFNANVGSLTITGEIYGQFRIHFTNSATRSNVGELTASLTGQEYQESKVDLPAFSYSGVGSVQAFTNFVTTQVGNPKFIINGRYWDGAAWNTSDGSYTQANFKTDVLTNIGSITASDTLNISVVFTTSFGSIDDLTMTYTGQKYSASGSILTNQAMDVNTMLSFSATITEPTVNDTVRFVAVVNGVYKYWSGTAWVDSDGSTQSNTYSDFMSNITTLVTSSNKVVKLLILLSSNDGSQTPNIDNAIFSFIYGADEPADPAVCQVYGYIMDIIGTPVRSARVTFTLQRDKKVYVEAASRLINPLEKTVTTDANGYFVISLIRSSEYENAATFAVKVVKENVFTLDKKQDGTALIFTVPDQDTLNITSVLNAAV